MSRSSLALLAILIGATLSMPAQAQWKWRDKAGHIQYSDLPPPPGIAEQDILQQPPASRRTAPSPSPSPATSPAASAPVPATSKVEPELEAKRKAAEQDAAAKQKAEEDKNAAIRASNCMKARGQLKALQDGIRMARTNAQGEREVLDDASRLEEIRNTQAIMASDCK